MTWPFLTCWPFFTIGLLVDAGAGIRAHELAQLVNVNARFRIVS